MYRAELKKFVENYSKNHKKHYKASAELCASFVSEIFKQKGIHAIITYRPKDDFSLFNKLKNKDSKNHYKNLNSVRADLKDLAGVRIALYFPEDCKEAEKVIDTLFDEVKKSKEFPESSKSKSSKTYKKRFLGYKAKHYYVKHKTKNLTKKELKLSNYHIEIQVASVLMHAWAEVEHDLIYKPTNGEISIEEHQILDELNGLVLTGELALARLQAAIERRLRENKPFNNKYDLHIYLNRYLLKNYSKIKSYNIGRIDYLYKFLELTNLNKPEKLEKYLENISFEEDEISDQVIAQILSLNPDFQDKYKEAIESIKNQNYPETYNKALKDLTIGWTQFQKTVFNHFLEEDKKLKPFRESMSQIYDQYSSILNSNTLSQINEIAKIKNQLENSFERLPLKQLAEANKKLNEATKEINEKLKYIP